MGCVLGIAVAAPFAMYIGVVFGGTVGGSWGWNLTDGTGTVIGIGLGLTVVGGTILLIGAAVGGMIGHVVDPLVSRTPATR